MEGHAAHGRALRQAALLPGERNFQLLRYGQRIVKKHLVKVSQTVEQNTVRILFLGLHVVLHHRG